VSSTACDDQFVKEPDLEEECRLARERGKTVCVWTKSDDDNIHYQSSCGGDYEAYENVPTFDRFDFCPFCGKPIKVKQ